MFSSPASKDARVRPVMVLKIATSSGIESQLLAHLSNEWFARPQQFGRDCSVSDVGDQLTHALTNPLNFPSLAETVFAGDRIAISLQSGLPHAHEIVRCLVERLTQYGIGPDDITVIVNPDLATELGMTQDEISHASSHQEDDESKTIMRTLGNATVAVKIHDATKQSQLAYIAANQAGDPIYINRQIVDADVILPIRFSSGAATNAITDGVYPEFSSTEVQQRFVESNRKTNLAEIELANDALGAFFSIQIVAGPGGSIERILYGERKEVAHESTRLATAIWELDCPADSDIIVATIETTTGKTDWNDVIRAVICADQLSQEGSSIVLWTELDEPPGRQIRNALLSLFDDSGTRKKKWAELEHFVDVLQRHPVYLKSRLERNEVEELGIGFVEGAADVNRIAEKGNKRILIRDAHQCRTRKGNQKIES